MNNVISFPYATPPVQPIAHFIRLGETGYQRLSNLHAAGRLPVSRVVVDASRAKHQKELLSALRAKGAEIILDTKVAELSSVEKFAGIARHTPWAEIGRGQPLPPAVFASAEPSDIYGRIARFAVEYGVDAVLAPAHFVGDPNYSDWLTIDHASCISLRKALDREGGNRIAIDYPLILSHLALNDDHARSQALGCLADLPFDNLWIRASGFGSHAAPLTTKRFIGAMASLHNLGRPIIADYLGGLVGQATLAFGAVSGIAHGIGERERFDARGWHKPVKKDLEGKGGGRTTRVLIAGLDRSATLPELELMANARGGRKLVSCCDRACCPHGLSDMISDPRQHAAYQVLSAVKDMAMVPDLNREQHFLNGRMTEVDRQARMFKELKFSPDEAKRLKVDPSALGKRLVEHSKQIEKMRRALEDLHESRADAPPHARSVSPRLNGIQSNKKTETK